MTVDLKRHSYPIYIEEFWKKQQKNSGSISGIKIMIISDDQEFILIAGLEKSYEEMSVRKPWFHMENRQKHSKPFRGYTVLFWKQRFPEQTWSCYTWRWSGRRPCGFVAAAFLRGIKFVQLQHHSAQVDSSVGGRVAVDLPQGKNLVGAFYQ